MYKKLLMMLCVLSASHAVAQVSVRHGCAGAPVDEARACWIETRAADGQLLSRLHWSAGRVEPVGGSGAIEHVAAYASKEHDFFKKHGGYRNQLILVNKHDGLLFAIDADEHCKIGKTLFAKHGLEGEERFYQFDLALEQLTQAGPKPAQYPCD